VVPRRDLEVPRLGGFDQLRRLRCGHRERLLEIHVSARFEALQTERVMALRGSGDVNDVRPHFAQQVAEFGEALVDGESLGELTRHQGLTVAHRDDPASRDATDRENVLIGDLPAAYYRHANHDQCTLSNWERKRSMASS